VPVGSGRHVSLGSFATRSAAERALLLATADKERGTWVDPRNGRLPLRDYAELWLVHRNIRPRTRELYESELRIHILPTLGELDLGNITPMAVRRWYSSMVSAGRPGSSTVAKVYRLLKTILATAVEDELIPRNPCLIRGAGIERTPERPVATPAQVAVIASSVEPRFRALVLMATYSTLRWGELVALRRRHLDLEQGTVRVEEQAVELAGGRLVVGPPKSEAGRRVVALPNKLVTEIEIHLDRYVPPGPDALVFTGEKGASLRRSNWSVKWRAATAASGVKGLRFHDLRHTGNTLAAATGASTKELMVRMGHSSARAALIYQHATVERERFIAAALYQVFVAEP
jgi:integrase